MQLSAVDGINSVTDVCRQCILHRWSSVRESLLTRLCS